MKTKVTFTGVKDLTRRMGAQKRTTVISASRGIIRAQLLVRNSSVKMTPIDTGNLRSSVTTPSPTISKGKVSGMISYTASYAAFVHENLEANFRAPGTGPKFLERALQQNRDRVLRIIRVEVKK